MVIEIVVSADHLAEIIDALTHGAQAANAGGHVQQSEAKHRVANEARLPATEVPYDQARVVDAARLGLLVGDSKNDRGRGLCACPGRICPVAR
jgi:hypothetical protein